MMKHAISLRPHQMRRSWRLLVPAFALFAAGLSAACAVTVLRPGSAAAACAALPADKGQVTSTITVPTAGTYRVWSRIMAPDTANNSFYLQIDNSTCGVVVGDNSAIPANTWTWVDYQNGTPGAAIDVSLAAGSHTLVMAGREDGVKLDRVVLTADLACIPSGTGDNCASPPDTTPPIVAITAPADGASVSGAVAVNAAATDDVSVAKVELYVDGALSATDATSPYNFALSSGALSAGQHTLMVKAYDSSGNTAAKSIRVTIQPPADTSPPAVSLTSPASGATISGMTALSATASDNVGVTKVEFYVDNALLVADTAAPYTASLDAGTLANGSHTIRAKAYDATGNTTSSTTTVTVNNASFSSEDINQDGHVNLLDLSLLIGKFGQQGNGLGRADVNGDGKVNILDLSLLIGQFGK